jgi:hypothetical protein
MPLLNPIDHLEIIAEDSMERARVVPRGGQTGAALRALGAERRHNDVSTGSYRMPHLFDIPFTRAWVDQEMEDGTIVPHREVFARQTRLYNLLGQPRHC